MAASITLSVIGHRSKIEKRRGTPRTVTKLGRCGCVSNETNTFHVALSLSLSLSLSLGSAASSNDSMTLFDGASKEIAESSAWTVVIDEDDGPVMVRCIGKFQSVRDFIESR